MKAVRLSRGLSKVGALFGIHPNVLDGGTPSGTFERKFKSLVPTAPVAIFSVTTLDEAKQLDILCNRHFQSSHTITWTPSFKAPLYPTSGTEAHTKALEGERSFQYDITQDLQIVVNLIRPFGVGEISEDRFTSRLTALYAPERNPAVTKELRKETSRHLSSYSQDALAFTVTLKAKGPDDQ